MTNCGDLTNDLLLDPTPAARAHLDACAACRAKAAEVRRLADDLAAIDPEPASDPDLVRRILSRVPRKALRVAGPKPSFGRWIAAAAAAAVVVAGVLVATREPVKTEPAVVTTPSPERPPIETILDPVPPPPIPKPLPLPDPPVRPPAPAPRPIEPAPALPAPKPVEPEKPAPAPVEPAKPVAPPTETRPARVFAAVTGVEGAIDLAGKKLEKGAEWEKDATLHAGDRMARLTLADGTRLTLRPRAELRLQAADELLLERGEIFCEVIPGNRRKFAVLTPDAAVRVTGTQFGVKRTDHTEVVVTAGEVTVANDKGEVAVPAGTGTTARKSSAPAKARIVDVDAMMAWRRAIDPPEAPRFRYDFEDARKPTPWQDGKPVAGPARGLNRGCLEGSPGINLDLSRVDRRVSTVKGALRLRFRYHASSGDALWVQFMDERVRDNFRFEVKGLAHGKWETFDVPLSDFYLLIDGAAKIQEGDRLTWFNISLSGTTGPVYFDDIELVEMLK